MFALNRKEDRTATPIVTGQLVIVDNTPAFQGATAYVRLEDITYADAAAIVMVEISIPNVNHPSPNGGNTIVPFTLQAPSDALVIDPRHAYTVRAWLDRNGDGKLGTGDLFSDQSYRVLTRDFGETVTITLAPVK